MLENINLFIAIVVGLCAIIGNGILTVQYIWRAAQRIGQLERRLEKSEQDLNNLRQITRQMVATETWKIQVQLTHIQEHLEDKTGYHAPSFQRYDD